MPIERPSDRIYCCFFCLEGTTRDKDASCPRCSKPINIAPLLEQRAVEKYTLKNAVGRGYYGITFHAENQIGRSYAVKLVPARIYEKHDKSFSEEIRKYNKLGSHPHIADLVDAGEVYLTVLGVETLFYFIVMEWIEGETLTKYIRECSAPCNEVYGAILDITSGLERFESQNLWHNDLNSDNILFKRLTAEERRTRRVDTPFVCKIVDVGSAVFRQAPIEGRIRDLAFLGHHINDLRKQSLKSDHQQTREDIFFLNSLEKVVARLLDEDQTRGFATAAEVSQEVSDLYQQRYLLTEPTAIDLDDPFAYLNANDFPNDTYINYLFSDRFPWVRDIVTPEAQGTLITGPRGSGKTMILRSMRLKTRLHPFEQSESVESIRQRVKNDYQLAFYVSARIEIGNQCSLSKLPRWATSEELTVYYFLLLYTVEILETLFYGSAKSILRYDSSAEVDFCKLICTSLCLSEHPTIQNVLREVKSRQYEIERDSLESTPPGVLLNSNYLSEVSRSIRQLCVEFSRKTITYLLDDFSLPKVPASVQRTLLPLIWNSGGGYSFRVSAHSESVVSEDLRQNRYQVNREYREINLGANYLNSIDVNRNETAIESSVGDIFARRFAASRRLTDLTVPSRSW